MSKQKQIATNHINMATPPESPIEEVVYELETTRVPKPVPVALEDLCRQTKFTRQEIRVMYRGFKTVSVIFFYIYIYVLMLLGYIIFIHYYTNIGVFPIRFLSM